MQLIQATISHREEMFACLESARSYFKDANIPQWQNPNYPCMLDVEEDIRNHSACVVVEGDKVIATATILLEDDPNYEIIEGKWLCEGSYGVIHRIAVLPEMKGKQVANHFIDHAIKLAKQANCVSLRIDTHELNTSMRRWIEKCGFIYCGIIYVADGTPRYAYELKL